MKVQGVDPVQMDRIQEHTGKPVIQEGKHQEDRNRQHDKALGREQRVLEQDKPQLEELEKSVMKLNEIADTFNTGIRFRIHEESERIKVEVFNRQTDEILREIPPEKVLNLIATIQSLIGFFVDVRR